MPWRPGDPWPGTPGGAVGGPTYPWGTSMRLYIRAGIAAGRPWTMGVHALDRLDSGNVIGPIAANASPPTINGRLWVDLTCDAIDTEIFDGSTRAVGIFSRDEASTLTLDLYDPDRTYDPLNRESPYWSAGKSRLVQGTPLEVFAEIINPATNVITKVVLFTGTADRWLHQVERDPVLRRTRVTASGAVKALANTNWPEQPAVGGGDTTAQRIARLCTYYGYAKGAIQVGASSGVTLAPTTLAASFWELLNRTLDDELGYVHVLPDGTVRWLSRNVWSASSAPAIVLGCKPGVTAFDVVTDVIMGSVDSQLRNAVYASRTGGVMQTVRSQASIDTHGGYETPLRRTDLGLNDDPQVATWANTVVMLYAYPSPAPELLELLPAVHGEPTGNVWRAVLGINYASDLARVVWTPTDGTAPLDVNVRVVGAKHTITPTAWKTEWQVVPATLAGNVWHMGVHALDRLDRGNIIGYAKTA